MYPLPRISDILSKLQGAEFFSVMDLQSGYNQLPLREKDRQKRTFVTPDGLFKLKILRLGWQMVLVRFKVLWILSWEEYAGHHASSTWLTS